MSYPGNASLAGAVKERVLSTFQQTLALYHQGRSAEVSAGCTLILQMDPSFEPARKLLDKSRDPSLPIDVDNLLPQPGKTPMQQAREAMAERDFQSVIQITTDILTDDLLNDEARILGDEAREKMEAAPFVEQFTRKCDQSVASGNLASAKMDLEKARALDATHPDVVRLSRAIAASSAAAPQAPATSFVVDDVPASPATGRSAAQAADFGFSFEEEKQPDTSFAGFSFDTPSNFSFDSPAPASAPDPGGFSFETPSAPAPSAVGGEFDFATASIETSADDQKKIEQYLVDGDRAAAGGDYQQAIDLWSRIFLIDVTNDQASERIEQAKAKRREVEQKLETLLSSGVTAFDRGDTAKAHADLTEVLRLDPTNTAAQDYLDRLGETAVEGGASGRAQTFIAPSISEDRLELGFFEDEAPPEGMESPLVPPSPGKTPAPKPAAAKKAAPAKPKAERRLPMGLIGAILAAVVLAGGGWFVWTKFMNKPEVESAGSGALNRASALASAGKYDQAIAVLRDIKPDDPDHDKALVMIADLQTKKSATAQTIDGMPSGEYFQKQIAAAIEAYNAHDYSAAKEAFEKATRVKPLPPEAKAQYDTALQQVGKLDAAKALFKEQKYSEALANLQLLQQQDPSNQSVQRLINDAHFNLGAQALREERTQDAIREMDEVLKVDPADELAKRSRDLAARYDGEPKDLLYTIYVKFLPLRQAM